MDGQKAWSVDLTGRQRSQWRLALRRLEAGGLLRSSLPAGLQALRPGSAPEAWIDEAEAKGQVLPWLLRQLALWPDDATLVGLGRDLGLCVCSPERLQASQGWRHWAGLESAVQGLRDLLGGRPCAEPHGRPRALELEGWSRRLLCLWWDGGAVAGPASSARSLVLDLGAAQLLPLAEGPDTLSRWAERPAGWQLGALPRHVLEPPARCEAWFEDAPGPQPPDFQTAGLQLPVRPRLRACRPASAALGCDQLDVPRAGPVLLMGADPGLPPQLCLALLRGSGPVWRHDADPQAMRGGGLCLDSELRLIGCLCPMNEESGRVHPLLSS